VALIVRREPEQAVAEALERLPEVVPTVAPYLANIVKIKL
jgi:hypothetical protein